jgi:hypothetical protein
MHVPASGEEIVCEFDDEYFGAVLQSVQSLARSLPVDGSESGIGPIVPGHEVLANAWTGSSLAKSRGTSSGDGFPMNGEACLGGWDEGNQFGWFGVVVEEVSGK